MVGIKKKIIIKHKMGEMIHKLSWGILSRRLIGVLGGGGENIGEGCGIGVM